MHALNFSATKPLLGSPSPKDTLPLHQASPTHPTSTSTLVKEVKSRFTCLTISIVAFQIFCEVAKQTSNYSVQYYNGGKYPVAQTTIVVAMELIKLMATVVRAKGKGFFTQTNMSCIWRRVYSVYSCKIRLMFPRNTISGANYAVAKEYRVQIGTKHLGNTPLFSPR